MKDERKTKKQFIAELAELRQRVAELEAAETEHQRAEEALREGEERLRNLFETMAEGVVLIAPDGQIVQANLAAERILGLERSEIEGLNYIDPEWEMLRPDGTPMPPEEMAGPRAMKEKRLVKDVVMGTKRPDGSISWINVSAAPLISEAGELGGIVGTFADITERKQVEEALRQKTEQQEVLLSSIPAFVYFKDIELQLITANEAFAEMVNTPIDQLLGKDAYDLFPKGQAEKFHIDDKKVMESGKPMMNIEEEFTDAEGKTRWASTSKVPYFDEKGKIAGMVGITLDITERVRVEEALRESESEKKSILNAISDVVLFQDTNLTIRWGNEAAAQSVGKTQQELVGYCCYELWHGRSEPCEGCPVLAALETESHAESVMATPDGRHWEVTGEPVRDGEGKIVGNGSTRTRSIATRLLRKSSPSSKKAERREIPKQPSGVKTVEPGLSPGIPGACWTKRAIQLGPSPSATTSPSASEWRGPFVQVNENTVPLLNHPTRLLLAKTGMDIIIP